MDKFGDINPTGPKVIHPNTLNLTQNFEFWLPHIIFSRDTQIFELTFEAPPIARLLAKFHGDRSRELGDLGSKWGKTVDPHFFVGGGGRCNAPNFGTCII